MTLVTKRLAAKPLKQLTETELEECRRLTLGEHAGMQSTMKWLFHEPSECAEALMIWGVDGKLVGWALFYQKEGKPASQYYVDEPYRRNGVGTKLAQAVMRRSKNSAVFPWDPASHRFFERFNNLEKTPYWNF